MTSIYGHRWTSQYGDCDADNTWAFGLLGLSPEQFSAGLHLCVAMSADRVRTGDEDWPPTLGEFRAYCETRSPAAHDYYPILAAPDSPPVSLEQKESYIAEMRAALGITKNREPGEDG